MAYHQTMVDPNGTGPLDHVDAYVDDSGNVHYPGDEGYVASESPSTVRNEAPSEPSPVEVSQMAKEQEAQQGMEAHERVHEAGMGQPAEGQETQGGTADPTAGEPGSPLEVAQNGA